MSCQSNSGNATVPSPAIAPGIESLDAQAIAAAARRLGERGVDPRILEVMPGFDGPFFQAGLAGYSDAAMRIIARRHGCPMCVTEALLDRSLLAGGHGFDKADLGELHDNVPGGSEDHPLVGQIMGSDPAEMAAAALKMVEQKARPDKDYRLLAYEKQGVLPSSRPEDVTARQHLRLPGGQQVGFWPPDEDLRDPGALSSTGCLDASMPRALPENSFEAIDVNLACPVKKIKSKARGGHWLGEPQGAIEILRAVREAVPAGIPCTVKMRRGYDDTPEMAANFEKIFDAAYSIGYAWVTVHARTVQQKYLGPSRWTFLKDLVERHPDKIIFGSGDVWQVDDIFRMIAYTGVHAVSVARGCIGNPWIFRQAREMMRGDPATQPTLAEQREVLRQHFELSLAVTASFRHGEETTSRMMRKFAIKFAQHHPRPDEVKKRMIGVASAEEWFKVLEEMYADGVAATANADAQG